MKQVQVAKNHISTKFQDYFLALDLKERERFAKRAGKTVGSIKVNYIRRLGRLHPEHLKFYKSTHAQPCSRVMILLSKATKGVCDYEDMLDHFYRK